MAVRAPTPAGVARRERILEEAARLFGRRGYHATSMRDIGEATGLLAGSLYAHIASKEDLLYEIVVQAGTDFIARLEEVEASERAPEERLRMAMRAHVSVLAGNVDAAWVFHHEWKALTGERRDEVRGLRRRYESLWDGIVADLPGATDRRFARLLVLSAANWTYTWYRPEGPLTPEEVADRFTDLLLAGLGAKEERS
ncbi:MAG TPA: TetR/AcrR family transcriptional regulator [Actinomycetota bacterium]|nr:TetR/AcrR family transcriptional regulator [Actinomycetota bacterium]